MFNDHPELSSDLEWMLQSGQATPAMLAEALVREYYAPVYRLALSLLEDEDAADLAARRTFRSALSSISRYRSSQSVDSWIFRIALSVTRKMTPGHTAGKLLKQVFIRRKSSPSTPKKEATVSLPQAARLPALLYYVQSWQIAQIAALLQKPEDEVERRLRTARLAFEKQLRQAGQPAEAGLPVEAVETALSEELHRRWPGRELTPGEVQWISAALLSDLEKQRSGRVSQIPISEIIWVGVLGVLAFGLVWGGNRLIPAADPTPTPRPPAAAAPTRQTIGTATQTQPARPPATPTAGPTHPVTVRYFTQPGDTLRTIATRLGASLDELTELNRLPPDLEIQVGKRIEVPLAPLPRLRFTPTPVSRPAHRLEPLSAQSSATEIYQVLLLSDQLWNTLWVDVLLVKHGPRGYVGPPLVARSQAWVSQPGLSKEVIGPPSGSPRYHFIQNEGRLYSLPPQNRTVWFQDIHHLLELSQLHDLVFPGRSRWIHQEGRFRAVQEALIAGRTAVIVDWLNADGQRERRLWVDARRGIVLRQQLFAGPDGGVLVEDIEVTQVSYDADYPAELFDPNADWVDGYARDPSGRPQIILRPGKAPSPEPAPGHAPLPYQPAPPDFDPAASQLTFQFPPEPNESSLRSSDRPVIDLFAGDFHLGSLAFTKPWGVQCVRSPDGKRIAYIPDNHWMEFNNFGVAPQLYWFDLSSVSNVRTLNTEIFAFDLAFAPDSRRLAVDGFSEASPGIFIVDTDQGEVTPLISLENSESLVWSPDGKYLALIGTITGWRSPEAMVIAVDTQELVYRTPVDFNQLQNRTDELDPHWPAPDWPGHDWGMAFPAQRSGLEACAAPPGK